MLFSNKTTQTAVTTFEQSLLVPMLAHPFAPMAHIDRVKFQPSFSDVTKYTSTIFNRKWSRKKGLFGVSMWSYRSHPSRLSSANVKTLTSQDHSVNPHFFYMIRSFIHQCKAEKLCFVGQHKYYYGIRLG